VTEAGGSLSTVTGSSFNIYGDSIVAAANDKLVQGITGLTSTFYAGPKI
jgi:hypothetical protein